MIPELRKNFNAAFSENRYQALLSTLESRCRARVEFRVAETPIFLTRALLESIAAEGAALAQSLLSDLEYLAAAQQAIPAGYTVARLTAHPHFLTADFALVKDANGLLAPKLVEIQAFPSVFAYQAELCGVYRQVFGLPTALGTYLGGLNEDTYWAMLRRTVLGSHAPENVVLAEIDPFNQKTLPDFLVTQKRLGIAIVDIASLVPVGNKLHYRNASGRLIPVHRIYNRAIADELMARRVQLPFDLTHEWDVEWAGHPNWYFLISKFSIPWLCRSRANLRVVPPAAFLSDFLDGRGFRDLAAAGVPLPGSISPDAVYNDLLLKPLFSFAGKGIQFAPSQTELEAIPLGQRRDYLVQQRMRFEPTIVTPYGLTQAEIRILYMWPDGDRLTPAIVLVRLGRGKMMGVDHNRDQLWVGGSAAFYPEHQP